MSFDRTHPFLSRIQERRLLSKDSSTRNTYHLSLTLQGSSLSYRPGDCVAILPSNDPASVEELLKALHLSGDEMIGDLSLRAYFTHRANLQKIHPSLCKAMAQEEFPEMLTPAEWIASHPSVSVPTNDLVQLFFPMLPRFYSIASAQSLYPEELHLLIAAISYQAGGHLRHGVASRFLCHDAKVGETPVKLYIQPSHGFSLPSDESPIILVGPGTGVAPFRAFLQDRLATQAKGRNWLFFGERHRVSDFYYDDFWLSLEKQGRLRLDLAFSRDGLEKIYVQHRMWEQRKDLWAWIEEGAYFYVCGNGKGMAKDVEEMLIRIASSEGNLSDDDARQKIKSLRAAKRYRMDVY